MFRSLLQSSKVHNEIDRFVNKVSDWLHVKKQPMKTYEKSVPMSIGFEYANNEKLFCDRLCLYLYIGIRKVGPTIEFTPPKNFMRMCAPARDQQ